MIDGPSTSLSGVARNETGRAWTASTRQKPPVWNFADGRIFPAQGPGVGRSGFGRKRFICPESPTKKVTLRSSENISVSWHGRC